MELASATHRHKLALRPDGPGPRTIAPPPPAHKTANTLRAGAARPAGHPTPSPTCNDRLRLREETGGREGLRRS